MMEKIMNTKTLKKVTNVFNMTKFVYLCDALGDVSFSVGVNFKDGVSDVVISDYKAKITKLFTCKTGDEAKRIAKLLKVPYSKKKPKNIGDVVREYSYGNDLYKEIYEN